MMGNKGFLPVGLVILALVALAKSQPPVFEKPCSDDYPHSRIFCYGDLLRTIQKARFFGDQKTFVDHTLKNEPAEVISSFEALNIIGENLTPEERNRLKEYVDANFMNGTEFEEWDPSDWKEEPEFLKSINDEHLRKYASELHDFWKELGRKISEEVKNNPSKHSMYYVSHPVIVPGGRFKEFYYWDSYWIQRGLLISNMAETVKGMIENFMEMVNELGFIPNGGRVYYQRSQPPLLSAMVDSYYMKTGDLSFIRNNFDTLKKEYNFFVEKRTVDVTDSEGKVHKMAHYSVDLTDPRPESFSEDYDLVEPLNIPRADKDLLYANLKSGAESGWDFSSRWFVVPDDESIIDATLAATKTRDILPVDLNSFLYKTASLLAKFCGLMRNPAVCDPKEFSDQADAWKEAIHKIMWDEEAGTWFDYDYVREKKRKQFYPTNLSPLWVQAQHTDINSVAKRSVNYLQMSGATNFPGGIPASMLNTGEQWDFPNGWAPLNHIVVEALENSKEPTAMKLALELAQKWVQSNHVAYLKTDIMFEKYDVSVFGAEGGGGEYEVVPGFGWSNGVILDFLQKYGDKLVSAEDLPEKTTTTAVTSTTTPSTTTASAETISRNSWVLIIPVILATLKHAF